MLRYSVVREVAPLLLRLLVAAAMVAPSSTKQTGEIIFSTAKYKGEHAFFTFVFVSDLSMLDLRVCTGRGAEKAETLEGVHLGTSRFCDFYEGKPKETNKGQKGTVYQGNPKHPKKGAKRGTA